MPANTVGFIIKMIGNGRAPCTPSEIYGDEFASKKLKYKF